VLAVTLLLLQLQAIPAPADEAQPLLLEVHLGPQILADALPIQQHGADFLVPLGEVCRLLDFAVEIDVARGRAAGFVLAEDRRFAFDATTGVATVAGVSTLVPHEQIAQQDGEIYIAAQVLARLLPVDFEVDLAGAMLQIRPRQPLPMQARLERERRAQGSGPAADLSASYPRADLPYEAWSLPFMDLRALGSSTPGPSGGMDDRRLSGNYSALMTGDLLFLESTIQAAGTDASPLETKRLTLGRTDPAAHLLGPLGASEVSVGEISYPGSDLIALSTPGTGFFIGNGPLYRPTEYDHHTFRGPLPPGWDVELYKNDALVGYQQSRADGRYEFDVPILFELNAFRLVFHGPEGQKREEVHTFNVGQSLTPPGQVHYRLSAAAPQNRGARTQLGLDLGLSSNVSAALEAATIELLDGHHAYGKGTLLGYWNRLFLTSSVVADERGGWGAQGAVQVRLESVGITLKRLYFDDFHSERLPETFGPVRHRTSLRINGTALWHLPIRVPIELDANRDELANGQSVRSLGGQISSSFRGFAVSNQLAWLEPPPGLGAPLSTGVARLGRTNPSLGLRAEAGYDLRPVARLTALALVGEVPFADSYLTSVGVNLAPAQRQTRLLGSLHKTTGRFGFGVLGNYLPGEGLSLTISVLAGVQRADQTRQWHSAAQPISGTAAASTRVFLDANDNGKLDPGEQPIEGAGFIVNNGAQQVLTGGDGTAFLKNMPSHQEVALGLSVATLEDPYWMSRRPGVRFVARPGRVAPVEFPLVVAGELTGTVYWRGAIARPISGILVELRDPAGHVVKSARSAYDGFYDLSGIPPGHYDLVVEPAQAARLGAHARVRAVHFAPSGTILDGVSVTLIPAPAAAATPASPEASALDGVAASSPPGP
jgi:hypothetical protein